MADELRACISARLPEPDQRCECGCGQLAEIEFLELFYTKACHLRIIAELKAAGIPIEESEKGWRLAPDTIIASRTKAIPRR